MAASLAEYLQHTVEAALVEATSTSTSTSFQRNHYARLSLPLRLLAEEAAHGDEHVGELLGKVLTGQSASASWPPDSNLHLDTLLDSLYLELLDQITTFVFPEDPLPPPLLPHLNTLVTSLNNNTVTSRKTRSTLLSILSSPSFAPPPLPSPPPLNDQAASIRLSTSTLAAAQAKHDLLLSTAKSSHLVHCADEVRRISDLHDGELRKKKKEVRALEDQLEGYERQMNILEGGVGRGTGRRAEGAYRILLGEWEELRREEREIKGDLRRLGWVE